jgi:ABC-type sugar transport system substrate-binding protein
MKRALLSAVVAAALVIAFGAVAHAKSAKYTGCLAKGDEANEFKLTNVDGGSDEYELVGGGKDMKNHVGHKIEVTGVKMSSKSAEKAEHAEKGESESSHKHLRVKAMRHIAETCP